MRIDLGARLERLEGRDRDREMQLVKEIAEVKRAHAVLAERAEDRSLVIKAVTAVIITLALAACAAVWRS
jgi:hypothetical protein